MATVTLTTAQALTLASGRLVCDITDVYTALNDILGINVMTHQIPAALHDARPIVVSALPWSNETRLSSHTAEFTLDDIADIISRCSEEHGATHTLEVE